jgi:hypothetical protein
LHLREPGRVRLLQVALASLRQRLDLPDLSLAPLLQSLLRRFQFLAQRLYLPLLFGDDCLIVLLEFQLAGCRRVPQRLNGGLVTLFGGAPFVC